MEHLADTYRCLLESARKHEVCRLTPGYFKYTPHEGPTLGNQNSRRLGISDLKLEESHCLFECYFEKYQRKYSNSIKIISFSFFKLLAIKTVVYNIEIVKQEAILK